MLHLPEDSPERMLGDAFRERRTLRELAEGRRICASALHDDAGLRPERARVLRLHLAALDARLAHHAEELGRVVDRMRLADRRSLVAALSSCSHTRPQERPRTHHRIEPPELWR